jgi:hypothetical protein
MSSAIARILRGEEMDVPRYVATSKPVVLKLLEMSAVHRLLVELGLVDGQGGCPPEGDEVEFHGGYVVVPWQGGWRNLPAEEFALRLQQQTGCLIAAREHGRIFEPDQLQGAHNNKLPNS